jgi:hypothetical protein
MTAIAALVVVATALPAFGHHSFAAVFDETKLMTLKGTVSKVEWVNPHVYLYLDVPDASGKITTWTVETFPPVTLRRAGVTRDKLGLGQNVTLEGSAPKDGSHTLLLRKMTFADGRELLIALGDINQLR